MNDAAAAVAPWIERLARVGYASKALVYTIIGGVAAGAAFGGKRSQGGDSGTAFRFIVEQPFGRLLMVVVAAGLLGYAAWRIIDAVTDGERRGRDAKGLALRAGGFFRGIVYAFLSLEAIRLAFGGGGGSSSDQNAQDSTARLLEAPFGRWLVVIAAAGVAGYGLYEMYRAWKAKIGKHLRLHWVTGEFRRRLVAISRFGMASRAVVFVLIGVSIARAAWERDAGEARGTSGALREIGSYSEWLLGVIAIGLMAYGVYQFVNARYRTIQA